jgi:hypothetical protein
MHINVDGNSFDISAGEAGGLFAGLMAFIATMWLFALVIMVIMIIGMWKVFEKAGREGWKSLIPFYNMYVLTEISGQNGWLFLLCLIPGVGSLIWSIMVSIKLAPAFGKETAFAVGLILLAPIFYMILGFGNAKYVLGGAPASAKSGEPKAPKDPWIAGK